MERFCKNGFLFDRVPNMPLVNLFKVDNSARVAQWINVLQHKWKVAGSDSTGPSAGLRDPTSYIIDIGSVKLLP